GATSVASATTATPASTVPSPRPEHTGAIAAATRGAETHALTPGAAVASSATAAAAHDAPAGVATATAPPAHTGPADVTRAPGNVVPLFGMARASAVHAPAPASAPAPTASNLPGVASQLTTVLSPLRHGANGTQTLTIALHPDGLGAVRATVTIDENQLVVR